MRKYLYLIVTTVVVISVFLLRQIISSIKWDSIGFYILIVMAVILAIWLFRRLAGSKNYGFRFKWKWSWFWWAVGIGYLVFAYHYYPWGQLEEIDERELKKNSCFFEVPDNIPSDIFMVTVHSGCPATVKMKPNQIIVWWGDKTKFVSGWFFKERTTPSGGVVRDKFRVFQVKGVNTVTIKIHRYHDPDPLWYTRQ
ncbi:MAG: hypothetical protein AAB586_01790 [Patescibacteria group bacterium]